MKNNGGLGVGGGVEGGHSEAHSHLLNRVTFATTLFSASCDDSSCDCEE